MQHRIVTLWLFEQEKSSLANPPSKQPQWSDRFSARGTQEGSIGDLYVSQVHFVSSWYETAPTAGFPSSMRLH